MKKNNEEKIKSISKVFKILTNILIAIMIIASAAIAISAVTIGIAMQKVEVKNGSVNLMNEVLLKFELEDTNLVITSEDKELYSITLDEEGMKTAKTLISKTTTKNATLAIEAIMLIGFIESILLIMIFNKVKNIFSDINEKGTPFVEKTPNNLKFISIIYGIMLIADIAFTIALSIITKTSISIDIPIYGIITIMFIMFLGYTSDYGYNLETKKTGK